MGRTTDRAAFSDPLQRVVLLESDADRTEIELRELTLAVDRRLGKISTTLIGILVTLIAALISLALNLIH